MHILTRLVSIVAATVLILSLYTLAEAEGYKNPLIHPDSVSDNIDLPHNTINILLLGIDFGHTGYWGSGGKRSLEDCHTDAMMVIAVNLDDKRADFVSLPRDTLTYVPGVKGIYKLNAAINCGSSMEDGLHKACDAASWVLGGIKIDYYLAVDMNAMAALGDAIGGVDFDLEMSYTGHSGRKYHKGLRHLDGTGIVDYLRSRTNATVNANDIGRTGRQRELMMAVFQKLKNDQDIFLKAAKAAQDMKDGFFTNILDASATDFLPMLPIAMGLNEQNVGSYVITGKYRSALYGWNFTFTDQENRQSVIKEVYGVDVPPLRYVDIKYTKWLVDSGFRSVHSLSVADQLRKYIAGYNMGDMTAKQQKAIQAFEVAYQEAARAFETASDSMSKEDTKIMSETRAKLRECGDSVAGMCKYKEKLPWVTGQYFYADPYINEVELNWK